jgi:hypothetical protein
MKCLLSTYSSQRHRQILQDFAAATQTNLDATDSKLSGNPTCQACGRDTSGYLCDRSPWIVEPHRNAQRATFQPQLISPGMNPSKHMVTCTTA